MRSSKNGQVKANHQLLTVLFQTTTTPAGQKATPKKSKYSISSDSSFAPFVFQNGKNKYTGIDMDLIKAIAKDQGFTIEINNPGFDAAVSDVQSGHAARNDCRDDRNRCSERNI